MRSSLAGRINFYMDLSSYTFSVVSFFSAFALFAHVLLAALLIALLMRRSAGGRILDWFSRNGLLLMLIVSAMAMGGSLYFSEISGWNPCKYCWIQRIFMYPQVVLLLIALWKKDRGVVTYILALSVIGMLYAAYHYYIQMYDIIASPANPATPCDASGESCVKTPFVHFGYITIPMLALTAFALNAVGSLLMMFRQPKS